MEPIDILKSAANIFQRSYSSSKRQNLLTKDTSLGLYRTLNGLCSLSNVLLSDFNFNFVLLGQFQSDCIEKEFGIYRQSAGSNYFVAAEQVLPTIRLRNLRLLSKMVKLEKKQNLIKIPLKQSHLELIDDILCASDLLTKEELSAVYYISGFVAAKYNTLQTDLSLNIHSFSFAW